MTRTITLILPLPPSANSLFLYRGRKRIISPEYRAWRLLAGLELKRQTSKMPAPAVAAPLGIDIAVPLKMRGDIDNRCKAILDLLVEHKIMDDDRHVHDLRIARKVVDYARQTAVVTVRTVEAAQ